MKRILSVPRPPRAGIVILYVVLILIILVGFVGFAVDVGRMRLARTQLQAAADAAARAGVSGLPLYSQSNGASIAINRASAYAAKNTCLGVAVAVSTDQSAALANRDIILGIWTGNNHTFHPLPYRDSAGHDHAVAEANAMQVTTRRLVSRSNPVKLIFAPVFGKFTNDIETTAIATIKGGQSGFGIIGLDWIKSNGTTDIDSYDAASGTYGGGNIHQNGSIATNGYIDLRGNVYVGGDARYGADPGDPDGHSEYISTNGTVDITGWQAPLSEDVSIIIPDTPNYSASNDNAVLTGVPGWDPSKRVLDTKNDNIVINCSTSSATPSRLYLSSVKIGSTGSLRINGYANIVCAGDFGGNGNPQLTIGDPGQVNLWVNGDVTLLGGIDVKSQNPSNLNIYCTKNGGDVKIGGNTNTYAHVFAPTGDISLHGTADFYGVLQGKTLDFGGTPGIHYDESIPGLHGPHKIALVK